MSRGSRWVIGAFSLLTGLLLIGVTEMMDSGIGGYLVSAFCLVVAIACFFPSTSPITSRLIGLGIFSGCLMYLVDELTRATPDPTRVTSPLKASMAMIVFGLPCGYLTITGKLPTASKFHNAFHGEDRSPPP